MRPAAAGDRGGGVEHIQRDAGIAVRVTRQPGQRLVVGLNPSAPSPRSRSSSARRMIATICCGAERLQHVNLGPRQQRGVHLERRILGGGADEDDVAGFDAGEKGVLL